MQWVKSDGKSGVYGALIIIAVADTKKSREQATPKPNY